MISTKFEKLLPYNSQEVFAQATRSSQKRKEYVVGEVRTGGVLPVFLWFWCLLLIISRSACKVVQGEALPPTAVALANGIKRWVLDWKGLSHPLPLELIFEVSFLE